MAVRDPGSHPEAEPPAVQEAARRHINATAWNLLLLIPLVGTLVPSVYNKTDPTLGGVPFFYWYQMLWIAVSVIVTLLVYRMTRGDR